MDPDARQYEATRRKDFTRRDWLNYYSRKRILHQWMQLHLLGTIDCEKVLEIGPALGLVTSMLVNSGYDVHTLDLGPPAFIYPDVPYHQKNLRDVESNEIGRYDAILCCEILEHIEWGRVGSILSKFRDSGTKYLIVSVPYMAFQVFLEVYLNRNTFRQYFSMKKLLWRKEFAPEQLGGHQWEVGYKGYPLQLWEKRLKDSGWSVVTRDFTEQCRSVFHLLKAA
jgi:hypothetical protein